MARKIAFYMERGMIDKAVNIISWQSLDNVYKYK